MRLIFWLAVPVSLAVLLAVSLLRRQHLDPRGSASGIHLVLVGASIGQAWHLSAWPSRAGLSGISAESVPAWQFDKSAAVSEVLMRPATPFHLTRTWLRSLYHPPRKADVVVLKECSSYFPGDLAAYRQQVRSWVRQLSEHRVKVVMATVVPVTRDRAREAPGKLESLLEFNRWVREYAASNAVPLLDLEAALRSGDDGFLADEFATEDGSHLNPAAYAVLDTILLKFVRGHDLAPAASTAAHTARP